MLFLEVTVMFPRLSLLPLLALQKQCRKVILFGTYKVIVHQLLSQNFHCVAWFFSFYFCPLSMCLAGVVSIESVFKYAKAMADAVAWSSPLPNLAGDEMLSCVPMSSLFAG